MNEKESFSIYFRGGKKVFTSPQVMGILNVTPDSFFDGSRKQTEKEIAERSNAIISEGGSIIDVGAFSTRPGAQEVSEAEEMRRLLFALGIVRRERPDAILSVDTFRPDVARMVVEEYGADIINDVSEGGITGIVDTPLEGTHDDIPEIFRMVAQLKVPYILMSVKPTMDTMKSALRKEIALLHDMGHDDIIIDPGYGFGKSIEQNYEVLARQEELRELGFPLLIGVSRKRLIWQTLGTSAREALNGTTAVNIMALERGGDILRVHDVREAAEAITIYKQLKNIL